MNQPNQQTQTTEQTNQSNQVQSQQTQTPQAGSMPPHPNPSPGPQALVEKEQEKGNILKISKEEQYKTVSELFEKAQPNSVYYSLLILSIFIIVTGLLLGNSPIVIGGMLVTPVLTPILVISLGIAVGEIRAIKNPGLLVLQSILITIAISTVLTFIFGAPELDQILSNTVKTAILYFIVATASGIAATFAWVRKQVADILPGISIAVSLVPPLSLVGVYLGLFDFESMRFYLVVFLLNFIGIFLGSLIVFSLLRFQLSSWAIKRKLEETEKIQAYKQAQKKAKKVEEKLEQIKKNIEEAEKLEESKIENKKTSN